jgi:hypothetical protein
LTNAPIHVGWEDQNFRIRKLDEVVQVAADMERRSACSRVVDTGDRFMRVRKQALLDLPCDLELMALLVVFAQERVGNGLAVPRRSLGREMPAARTGDRIKRARRLTSALMDQVAVTSWRRSSRASAGYSAAASPWKPPSENRSRPSAMP